MRAIPVHMVAAAHHLLSSLISSPAPQFSFVFYPSPVLWPASPLWKKSLYGTTHFTCHLCLKPKLYLKVLNPPVSFPVSHLHVKLPDMLHLRELTNHPSRERKAAAVRDSVPIEVSQRNSKTQLEF